MQKSLFACLASALVLLDHVSALSLQDFTKCIGPQGTGPVCQLDAGTYPLSTQLQIGRSNITIKGTIVTSAFDTVLQRAPGWHYSLLIDVVPPSSIPPVTSITIRDLTFDGNRSQNTDVYSSYFSELNLNTTTSVLVTNCDFINSPFFSFVVYGRGASGVVVNNSQFENSTISGFWTGSATYTPMLTYQQCSGLQVADDIVITNSTFQNFGQNALYASATNFQLVNNSFTGTDTLPIGPYLPAGGQIDLDPCTDNAVVVRNSFIGGTPPPGAGNSQGIELHGNDISVINNTVQGNWGDGVSIGGAANVFIANWDATTSISGNGFLANGGKGGGSGIAMHQGDPGAYDSQRPIDFITIDQSTITNNSAAGILTNDAAVPINHLTITNNCLANNASPQINLSDLGTDVVVTNNRTSGCGQN